MSGKIDVGFLAEIDIMTIYHTTPYGIAYNENDPKYTISEAEANSPVKSNLKYNFKESRGTYTNR